jgi:hypothetical protein
MSVLFQNQYLAICRSNRTYDFIHYNPVTLLWDKVAPPMVQGIYVNYQTHPIANSDTHVTLAVGRKKVRIDIRVTRDILKQTNSADWICIATLRDGKNFRNPYARLQKRDIPILTRLDGPVRVGRRVLMGPVVPTIPLFEEDDPPVLTIPHQIPRDYHPLYRAMYDLIVPLWFDTSHEPTSGQNPNVITNRVMNRVIEFGTSIENHVNMRRVLPKHVAEMIANDAVAREEVCPITMDPITLETCAVTSCFHVFERDALAMWHVANNTCPVCKQGCSIAVIGEGASGE